MKNKALGVLLLAISCATGSAFAAGKAVSTALQVSFVVQEACTVQATDAASAPQVSCAYQAPVQVTSQARAAVASQAPSDGQDWQIYF